jgi:hypothetical protein
MNAGDFSISVLGSHLDALPFNKTHVFLAILGIFVEHGRASLDRLALFFEASEITAGSPFNVRYNRISHKRRSFRTLELTSPEESAASSGFGRALKTSHCRQRRRCLGKSRPESREALSSPEGNNL